MKLTNGEIFKAAAPLGDLSKQKFPIKTSLDLMNLAKKVEALLEPINEIRMRLFKEYGEQDKKGLICPEFILVPDEEHDGKMQQVPNPNYAKLLKETEELLAIEVELEDFVAITLPANAELSASDLMALEKFVKI